MATSDWISAAALVLSVISILWQFVRERMPSISAYSSGRTRHIKSVDKRYAL